VRELQYSLSRQIWNFSTDRTVFFAALRRRASGVFGTSLTQGQMDGINGFLDAFATSGDGREKTLAYALASGPRTKYPTDGWGRYKR